MVCERCEKKLAKVIVPDKWKEGASNTTECGGRKSTRINSSLRKKVMDFHTSNSGGVILHELIWSFISCRWSPYGNTKCIICKQQVHQDAKYCHPCDYSKGIWERQKHPNCSVLFSQHPGVK
ncbi:cysteine-rich PDZ-binding protein [Salix suchowensis]|nr:cysteine-rich PDZ-binding protein [Salix suchowensis]